MKLEDAICTGTGAVMTLSVMVRARNQFLKGPDAPPKSRETMERTESSLRGTGISRPFELTMSGDSTAMAGCVSI